MTPERLEEISEKYGRISDYGNERMHAEAACEFIPELIAEVDRLQAEREKMLRLLRWAAKVSPYNSLRDPEWWYPREDKANARELRELLEEDREQA